MSLESPLSSVRRCAALAVLAASCLLAACGASEDARPRPARGYILISIDTLRADHLGTYGYPKPTSPFIDSFAERSVLFENAFVQLPGTLPSHMSIFTGLYPAEHAVYPPNGVLSAKIPTLPEMFRSSGFRTAGFSEGGYVHGGFGFERGFDEWNDEVHEGAGDIENTMAKGLDFLRRLRKKDRFFLFLHSYAVHDPYLPPEPYASDFGAAPVPGAFAPTGWKFEQFNRGELSISPEALESYRAAYDASIRYMDEILSRFFADLEELGLMDDVGIVLTSDHGEEFLEHGKMVHTQLYRETLHVPLLVYHPDLEPRRVTTLVESIDIAPSLRQLAGLTAEAEFSGESLVPLLLGERPDSVPSAFAEAYETSSRTLVGQTDDGLFQYLEIEPRYIRGGAWIARSISFDKIDGELRFNVYSYHQERELKVLVDGEQLASYVLRPDAMVSVDLEIPGSPARKRITLTSDGCVSPLELGESDDPRCLSFRVENLALMSTELYELRSDPQSKTDLSDVHREMTVNFHRSLDRYPRGPGVATTTQDLDPELVRRLESLGYAQ